MSGFPPFDTAGCVSHDNITGTLIWADLTPAEQRRVCAAAHRFWMSLDESVRAAMLHLGHSVAFADFTPRALARVMATDLPVPLAINAEGDLDLVEQP